jgi:hypothetical protein
MPTVADVLRRYGGEYLERFGATMPGDHKKVLRAITACRTGALGTVLYEGLERALPSADFGPVLFWELLRLEARFSGLIMGRSQFV